MGSDLFDVKGLIVVITGGGTGMSGSSRTCLPGKFCEDQTHETNKKSGVGLMLTQALASNGAIVYIIGRRLDLLEAAAKTEVRTQLPMIAVMLT
jgi:short-subunit dehydrogenase involved in D-alanine esterification of teichoic acids